MPRTTETLPIEPFQAWLRRRIRRYEYVYEFAGELGGMCNANQQVAWDLEVAERTLYRYLVGRGETRRSGKRRTMRIDRLERSIVEEVLWRDGAFLWEVYPDLPEFKDRDLTPVFCDRCEEFVMADDDGACLWCPPRPGRAAPSNPIVVVKPCERCGDPIPTKNPSGRIRRPHDYKTLRYCSSACRAVFISPPPKAKRALRVLELPSKECEWCGGSYSRRRLPSGELVRSNVWNKQRFCSTKCAAHGRVRDRAAA